MAVINDIGGDNLLFGTLLADDISGLGGQDDISGRVAMTGCPADAATTTCQAMPA
jgi:hypothetical protein